MEIFVWLSTNAKEKTAGGMRSSVGEVRVPHLWPPVGRPCTFDERTDTGGVW